MNSDNWPNDYSLSKINNYPKSDLYTAGSTIWSRQKSAGVQQEGGFVSPKVSIIIPFFNVEKYIEECLESVITQDYPNIEVILVDDASPDGSRLIAQRFAAGDRRIHIVTLLQNAGLGPARNTGVQYAAGIYLLFLDSDDLLSTPSAVSILVARSEQTGCSVVVGSCQRLLLDGSVDEFDRKFDRDLDGRPGEVYSGRDAYLGTMCVRGYRYMPMRAWGSLVNRAYYNRVALEFPACEHEDMCHTPFLYDQSGGVFYAPEIVVTYRDRTGSISNAPWSAEKIQRYYELWRQMKANIERFGLDDQRGDAAVKLAEHLVWKIQTNGVVNAPNECVIGILEAILHDATNVSNKRLFFNAMDSIRQFGGFGSVGYAQYFRLLGSIPVGILLDYYCDRLGFPDRTVPTVATAAAPSGMMPEGDREQSDLISAQADAIRPPEDHRESEQHPGKHDEPANVTGRHDEAGQRARDAAARGNDAATELFDVRRNAVQTEAKMLLIKRQAEEAEARTLEALWVCDQYVARESQFRDALNAERGRYEAQFQEALNAERGRYEAVIRSTSWRITGPVRYIADRFPRLKAHARSVLAPAYRFLQFEAYRLGLKRH